MKISEQIELQITATMLEKGLKHDDILYVDAGPRVIEYLSEEGLMVDIHMGLPCFKLSRAVFQEKQLGAMEITVTYVTRERADETLLELEHPN